MDDLTKSLKTSLATTFAFYLKAQYFHWNVEGVEFYQYHKMFGDIYEDTYGSIDRLAEHIRALNAYAPGSFKRLSELSKIEDEATKIPDSHEMIERLISDNEKLLDSLNETMKLAETHNKQGLMNYLGERIEQHNKWGWFLRASKKEQ